ncbi:MAG: hypothetical protein ASARMPRED_001627 [Alectoria sarmentosa]|nr:MAG: hypothetical protein ASARMPRED_001627 [Alectoria sarmentosa]
MGTTSSDNEPTTDSGNFDTSLYFFARCYEHKTVKPYALRYQPDDDLPRTNFVAEKRRIKVHDIRQNQTKLTFEKCGFQILSFPSSMSHDDFLDSYKIQSVYLKEVREMLKKALDAPHAYILDYAVRSRGSSFPYSEGSQRDDVAYQPIHMAHIDLTFSEAVRVIKHLYGHNAPSVLGARWHVVTIWQPLKGPVRDWPLGLCDASTVNFNEDTMASDIVFPDHYTENVQVHHDPQHKWYYLSDQKPDEALVFKTVYGQRLGA